MLKKTLLTLLAVLMTANLAFAAKPIVIAHDATWPPMEFINAEKQIVGYSVDYTDAIAKELGITVEHKNVAWDGIFAGLANGNYDMIASSVSITEERKEKFDFTTPYFEVKQAVILAADSAAATLADLKGKTVGGQIGTTGVFVAKKDGGVVTKEFDEVGHAVEALFTGRIDAAICDDVTAYDYVLNNEKYSGKLKVGFIVEADEKEYYGFVVKKGNTELLNLLNKGIEAVKAKGIEAELREKWVGK
ncbi:basic amino acid ABC transporter substrate-binding protein [Desulfovibrio psychrotolerans]|uniref:Basic amino acid ABC transporter substrate-binding protein n=1 Tax=Desulfovibrio psychrotolerans TaxID=415242 RepID=A0A7J0BUP5_9BACT|nr:basic amino acid ABC transporter substrate-binding protein [Desulfovibrio psychrotolerans]GFM37426.1 basic amino acid ABC transporter substrate-binding protein [Desulfovibrio psychrotolerans]